MCWPAHVLSLSSKIRAAALSMADALSTVLFSSLKPSDLFSMDLCVLRPNSIPLPGWRQLPWRRLLRPAAHRPTPQKLPGGQPSRRISPLSWCGSLSTTCNDGLVTMLHEACLVCSSPAHASIAEERYVHWREMGPSKMLVAPLTSAFKWWSLPAMRKGFAQALTGQDWCRGSPHKLQ